MSAHLWAATHVWLRPPRRKTGTVGAMATSVAGSGRRAVAARVFEAARRKPGRWLSTRRVISIGLLLLAVLIVGCADQGAPQAESPLATQGEGPSARVQLGDVQPMPAADAVSVAQSSTEPSVQVPITTAGGAPALAVEPPVVAGGSGSTFADRSRKPPGATSSAAAYAAPVEAPTVENLLEKGLYLSEASPAHLAIRGTPAASSVRCAWRGIARTAQQRSEVIRFWFQLGASDPIPDAIELEVLFRIVLDGINPEFRETAKANFLAIARGGESMDYLFLTCFADYAVTSFLLGTGTTPTTVTVAYDRMGEAASYDLYVREHDTGTYGTAALQTRGEYEAALQAQVVAAETALSAEIGGREAVVFLAPMGAHNAIGFEAWQAVAQWAVVTDDAGVAQAVRDDTPAGDPEHTQTLANLTSRITTAAAGDAHATTRVTTVGGLQTHYHTTLLAYADITPGDGVTTTFTPAQPPAAPTCTNGTVFANPADNRELVKDCQALLAAKDTLRGTATLNWSTGTAMSSWTGVTTGGTPTRVTGLSLAMLGP